MRAEVHGLSPAEVAGWIAEAGRLRAENDRAYSYAVGFLRAFIDNNDQRQVEPMPTLTGVLTQIDNATTITKSLRAENGRLREALEFLMKTKWKSVDKDNMEFEGRVTCYQLDKARAALEDAPQ